MGYEMRNNTIVRGLLYPCSKHDVLPKGNFLGPTCAAPSYGTPSSPLPSPSVTSVLAFLDHKLLPSLSPPRCLPLYLAKKRNLKNTWKMNKEQINLSVLICSHLHLKSHDPAASKTLLGCQSKLRTVERIGFLMCLLTHLQKEKIRFSLSTHWATVSKGPDKGVSGDTHVACRSSARERNEQREKSHK